LSIQERSICENLDASYPFSLCISDTFWKCGVEEGLAKVMQMHGLAALSRALVDHPPLKSLFHDSLGPGHLAMGAYGAGGVTDIRSLNVNGRRELAGSQVIKETQEMAEYSV
jgi:hypothetical protein